MTLTSTVNVNDEILKCLFSQSLLITNVWVYLFYFVHFVFFFNLDRLHLPSLCNCPIDLSILLLVVLQRSAQSVRKILFGGIKYYLGHMLSFRFVLFPLQHMEIRISKRISKKIREDKNEFISHVHNRI